jgi:hypothetical protein
VGLLGVVMTSSHPNVVVVPLAVVAVTEEVGARAPWARAPAGQDSKPSGRY